MDFLPGLNEQVVSVLWDCSNNATLQWHVEGAAVRVATASAEIAPEEVCEEPPYRPSPTSMPTVGASPPATATTSPTATATASSTPTASTTPKPTATASPTPPTEGNVEIYLTNGNYLGGRQCHGVFGYENTESYTFTIPRGQNNKLLYCKKIGQEPGQCNSTGISLQETLPELFLPGDHSSALNVYWNCGSGLRKCLKWVLLPGENVDSAWWCK